MNKLYLYPNPTKESAVNALPELCDRLLKIGFELFLNKGSEKYISELKNIVYTDEETALSLCDCVLVIGGDGTILHFAGKAASSKKPILGINFGKVGYLSELEINELDMIASLLKNDFSIEKRMMLNVVLKDANGNIKYEKDVLNEVSVIRAMQARIVDFSVIVNGKNMMDFSGDGIIVASPTGSTAYSLSAGGPILEPSCECIVVTPVCPHALNIKSVVLPATHTISLKTEGKDVSAALTADGFRPFGIGPGDVVEVKRATKEVSLIRIKGTDFYNTICNKLSKGRR